MNKPNKKGEDCDECGGYGIIGRDCPNCVTVPREIIVNDLEDAKALKPLPLKALFKLFVADEKAKQSR